MSSKKEPKPLTPIDVVMRATGKGRPAAALILNGISDTDATALVDAYASKKNVRDMIASSYNGPKPVKPKAPPIKKPAASPPE